jgi:sentrin-specific protease 8
MNERDDISMLFSENKRQHLIFTFCLKETDTESVLDESIGMNDECIDFWWEKVEQVSPQHRESLHGAAFICPSAMYFINSTESMEVIQQTLKDLRLDQKELIVMPVNDNSGDICGGTHWSLLCYHRAQNQFRMYDSLGRKNEFAAARTCSRISPIIGAHQGGCRRRPPDDG